MVQEVLVALFSIQSIASMVNYYQGIHEVH